MTNDQGNDPLFDRTYFDKAFDELDDMARNMAADPLWEQLKQLADGATDDPELAGLLHLVDDAAASLQRDTEVRHLAEEVAGELGYSATLGPVGCIQQMRAEIIALRAEVTAYRRGAAAT